MSPPATESHMMALTPDPPFGEVKLGSSMLVLMMGIWTEFKLVCYLVGLYQLEVSARYFIFHLASLFVV